MPIGPYSEDYSQNYRYHFTVVTLF